MKRYSLLIISISCIIIYIIFNSSEGSIPIEDIGISSGVSLDLITNRSLNEYNVVSSIYNFNKKDEISSEILEGTGKNIPDTRSTRQTISGKLYFLGLQKVLIFSETSVTHGINHLIDILMANQELNDAAWIVVCKDKAIDMLKFKVNDAPTAADHINDMIESSKNQNFMSKDYKVIDMYARVNSEGRNLVIPYLEILNKKITISGMAVFNKDKMVTKIPMEESRYMNFLRNNKVKGILTLQKDSSHWISTYGEVKRKVYCKKINGKYKFNIDLEFKGKVANNTLYNDFMNNPKTIEKYTHELEEETKKKCNKFIYRMQNQYKTDCLELGRDAAATFGRNPKTDWNEVVCNSDITVYVTVKVDSLGRGQFLYKSK